MEHKKISQEINNIVSDNVNMLAQLFPSAVKDGQVDFVALKEELGQFEEVGKEKYELTWSGKQNAKKMAQEDVYNRTLKYVEKDSKNPETTENLYIEGDNLEVLKLLRQNYYGAIKMIYIDPPYNTGNDFVYKDSFSMSTEESDIAEGTRTVDNEKLQKNQRSTNKYHANWLNMMYPRLKVAKDLLTDDGVIFISIDDNEVDNLKKVCNDVLGEKNFVAGFIVVRSEGGGLAKQAVIGHDYLLCYAKSISDFVPLGRPKDIRGKIVTINDEEYWIETDWLRKEFGKYGTCPYEEIEKWKGKDKKIEIDKGIENGQYTLIEKEDCHIVGRYRKAAEDTSKFYTILKHLNKKGVHDLKELNLSAYFNFPKPIDLLKELVLGATIKNKNCIILDYFSGSATTAHATMQLNAEDGGNRKFIMVQVPEETEKNSEAYKAGYKNICEIGKERIRRAGEKIKEEIETSNAQLKLGEEPKKVPDIGFKVFRASDTNIKWNLTNDLGQISLDNAAVSPDSIDFVMGANDIDVVYEIMLRQKDVPLSETLEVLTDIGDRTYLYASSYLICLETIISEDMIDKLSSLEPLPIKFVFRDSAFGDDISFKDYTFRRLSALIEKNSGLTKKAYTVEFL
ncbi:MAG: site-specific DNA-methyltransferase [Erysipelotrichaceae bacterium]